jgi:hypothetical protein
MMTTARPRFRRTAQLTAALALALSFAAPVAAADPQALAAASAQAESLEARLSERYAQIWAALTGEARGRFAAEERQWLHAARWAEHAACVAGSKDQELAVAECRARIAEQRLRALNVAQQRG